MCYYCGNGVSGTYSSTTVGNAVNSYKTKEEIDRQIKDRRMTDAESMGMLFDDPLDLP